MRNSSAPLRALKFCTAVMQVLGNEARFCESEEPWAGWHSEGRRTTQTTTVRISETQRETSYALPPTERHSCFCSRFDQPLFEMH